MPWREAGPSSAQHLLSCRNLNDDVIPQVEALQVTANIVFGYATWVSSPAPPAEPQSGAAAQPPPRLSPVLRCSHGLMSPSGRCCQLSSSSLSPSQGRKMPMALLSFRQHPRGLSPDASPERRDLG